MIPVTAEQILRLCPHADQILVSSVAPHFAPMQARYQVDRPRRVAALMGQLAVESAGFRAVVEYASGHEYEGRRDLGNTETGDGVRFKGRGLIQITGRANYRAMGRFLGLPLEQNPDLCAEPEVAVLTAGAFWASRNLNTFADAWDLREITRRIQGGAGMLAERIALSTRAAVIWDADLKGSVPSGALTLSIQRALNALGQHPPLAEDGAYGPATRTAVIAFQRGRGLAQDGIAGPETLTALGCI